MSGRLPKARVVVVDDHQLVRAVVRMACEGHPGLEVVGEAGDGLEALSLLRALRPDVLVLDLILPGMSGFELAARLAQEMPHLRILVITGTDERSAVFEALRLGIMGYVEKTASIEEIGDAIAAVAAGQHAYGPELERRAQAELGEFARKARETAQAMALLTKREREVLTAVSEGLSTRQIAKRLGLSTRTVETHIGNIYQKLDVRTRVQAVHRAAGLGLVEWGASGDP